MCVDFKCISAVVSGEEIRVIGSDRLEEAVRQVYGRLSATHTHTHTLTLAFTRSFTRTHTQDVTQAVCLCPDLLSEFPQLNLSHALSFLFHELPYKRPSINNNQPSHTHTCTDARARLTVVHV